MTKGETDTNFASDPNLVARIIDRDESALSEAIIQYGPQVRAICLKICREELDADGVMSVVFWELWNHSEKFDRQRGTLRTYLMTLARSRSIDRLRERTAAKRNQDQYVDKVAVESTASHTDFWEMETRQEQNQVLQQAIKQLPVPQRTALQLAFFEGLSHSQVADRQAIPIGTVKTNIRRGLQRLRDFLTESTATEGAV